MSPDYMCTYKQTWVPASKSTTNITNSQQEKNKLKNKQWTITKRMREHLDSWHSKKDQSDYKNKRKGSTRTQASN